MSPESAPGVTPEDWRAFLDEAGIDQAVLYPTAGLAIGLIQKAEWAVALARAYNNWLYERYLRADPSDFPHERARSDFLKDVPEFLERDDVAEATKAAILAENARRFYRL